MQPGMNNSLVAVDWGTSALRTALLGPAGEVLEERTSPRGILTVEAGAFPQVLQETCGDWLQDPAALCLVSGMAGSRNGWREAPYCPCPAGFTELAQALTWIEPGRIALVPGLTCENDGVPDVMRGEEVQVFGAMSLLGMQDGLFVLPGTHSKRVEVHEGRIRSFATFMSGECYALLKEHSILARTLPAEDGRMDEEAFKRGVRQAHQTGSLLRSAFSVRSLALFNRLSNEGMGSYLSGLVIGEELRLRDPAVHDVVLIGSETLTQRYALALQVLGVASRSLGSEAAWQGLWRLSQTLERA
ncbi:MAG: 2-dehydro-3-deoxygalactonokinase [Ramlibacter sp.]|jgi:2-dehydro-3-deoxygalactonokinase|nr:2-dehydro-3-deoxygalactonokinase [Ramlibacter sp.]